MKNIFFLFCTILFSCNQQPTSTINNKDSIIEKNDWALLHFNKADSANPILIPGQNNFIDPIIHQTIFWEAKDVFNPAIVVRNDTLFMLYRAQDKVGKPDGTSRIGLAESVDGIHFTKYAQPVLFPDKDAYKKYEWQGGCEDPRVVEDENGMYYMTYTSFDGKIARLMIATSKDLLHWKKYGPAFADAYNGKYLNKWSKSGSIVSTYTNGKIIPAKINGQYWMYWGDVFIWTATSNDLIHWTPVEKNKNEIINDSLKSEALNMLDLKIVVNTRKKKFDSDLVESGPPAMLTDKGILLLYNSRNIKSIGDTSIAEGTYAAGQILLNKNAPTEKIHRLNNYFIKPDKPYEFSGQVNNVCFIEGLAHFHNKWFLYYGTADSKIAVAVSDDH